MQRKRKLGAPNTPRRWSIAMVMPARHIPPLCSVPTTERHRVGHSSRIVVCMTVCLERWITRSHCTQRRPDGGRGGSCRGVQISQSPRQGIREELGKLVLESLSYGRSSTGSKVHTSLLQCQGNAAVCRGAPVMVRQFFANHPDISERQPCPEEMRSQVDDKANSLKHFDFLGGALTRTGILVDQDRGSTACAEL